jgi:hypothetical protein
MLSRLAPPHGVLSLGRGCAEQAALLAARCSSRDEDASSRAPLSSRRYCSWGHAYPIAWLDACYKTPLPHAASVFPLVARTPLALPATSACPPPCLNLVYLLNLLVSHRWAEVWKASSWCYKVPIDANVANTFHGCYRPLPTVLQRAAFGATRFMSPAICGFTV